MAGSKSYLLIDSFITCMQSTETTLAGSITYMDITNWLATQLISIVNPSIFRIRCNSVKL